MIKEFVPYTESLALKELGFNEPCFCWFDERFKDDLLQDRVCGNDALYFTDLDCSAPIFQQAFRWFREKHKLDIVIQPHIVGYYAKILVNNKASFDIIGTYEEAELECLKKLIEIVKNK
jgi:predicted GNAT superfamily acetyltransferase